MVAVQLSRPRHRIPPCRGRECGRVVGDDLAGGTRAASPVPGCSELTEREGPGNIRSCHRPAGLTYLAREEIERLRRSIAMLQPGSMAMKREDAMRLLGDLGEVQSRLDRLCAALRALLAEQD